MGDQCLYRQDKGSEAAYLMAAVESARVAAGMIGVEVPWEDVERYGVIETSAAGHFVAIHDKPSRHSAPSNLNNASFYCIPAEFMAYIDANKAAPHSGNTIDN